MSQVHRFFSAQALIQGESLVLDADSSRVIESVLRLEEKDLITLLDGKGAVAEAVLTGVRKKEVICRIQELTNIPERKKHLSILQGLLKGEKSEWIVQKGTELGVSDFYFFEGKHSVSKMNPKHQDRLEKIAIEALRQSGNPFLPRIHLFPSLKNFFARTPLLPVLRLWMNETEQAIYMKNYLSSREGGKGVAAIGPEGGWSEEEAQLLKEHDFCSIRLGSYILRSETAAVSVAACWNMFAVDGSST